MSRFYANASSGAVAISPAPRGGWTWIHEPRAIGYGGYTYYGYCYASGGTAYTSMQVIADGSSVPGVEIVLASAGGTMDEHGAPTFLVRASDHKLLVFYQVGSDIYIRLSANSLDTDPTLSGGLGAGVTLNSLISVNVSSHNYPNPIQLTGEASSPIYLFYRDNAVTPASNGTWRYAKSTDEGVTWTYVAALCQSSTLSEWGFLRPVPNGTTRIDFMFANISTPTTVPLTGSLYHFYYSGGSFYKSDGTAAGSPLLHETDMTQVYDGSTNPSWWTDLQIDGSNRPIMAFPTYPSSTDHRYNVATWSGSAWSSRQIVAAGSYMASVSGPGGVQVYYPAGLAFQSDDTTILYASVQVGSTWQLRKYVTTDGWASAWTYSTVSPTSQKNIRPVSPRNPGTRKILWTYGTWGDYTSYDLATMSPS